ncbi:MAG: hydrogenase expression/formation protein HypE [Desulfovibrio sp.]|nr:hydrogenase expression/formation protein HypE [Desulfovibrio sp.]
MMEQTILLAHGGGGDKTNELIGRIFSRHFSNPLLTADDAALLPLGDKTLAFSTDGFIVSPYRFPGGNIGKLSICGTVNDLACMGAEPRWMTCAFVLEEGFPVDELEQIAASMAETAKKAGVVLVAGDTKVCARGQVDKIFITTSGIGIKKEGVATSGSFAKPGDAILVTGDIGRHGATILLAREEFGIEAAITSDCAPLWHLVNKALTICPDIHVIRDATRGGFGTVLYEIAGQSGLGMQIQEERIPVDGAVSGICSMLGLDPVYLACEGRLVMIVPKEAREAVLAGIREEEDGEKAAIVGYVAGKEQAGRVLMETSLGTVRLLPKPTGELLPRIC